MNMLIRFFRILCIIFFIILQQGFLIILGSFCFAKDYEGAAIFVWALCLPMLYINYQTYKFIMKYGIVNFNTTLSDTSEIDVEKGKRSYKEN